MEKQKIYIFIIAFLVILNMLLLYYLKEGKFSNTTNSYLSELNSVTMYESIGRESESDVVSDSIILEDLSGGKFLLSNLMNQLDNENFLVLRFHDVGCNICVDSCLKALIRIIPKKSKDKVLILTNFNSERNFGLFIRLTKLPFRIYNCTSYFNIEAEKFLTPYLFILNKNGGVSSVFLPEKNVPYRTELYLQYIFGKYFKYDEVR